LDYKYRWLLIQSYCYKSLSRNSYRPGVLLTIITGTSIEMLTFNLYRGDFMRKSLWQRSKKMAPLFGLLFLTTLFTACGSVGSIVSQPAPTPTPAPRTLQKLLADGKDAMGKLSTEHIVITMSMKSQGGNTGGTSSESMKYDADMKKPHQLSVKTSTDLQITTMDQKQNTDEVIDGDKLYMQNKLGKWFVIGNGAASTKPAVASEKFFQLAMQGKITDKGHVMMDGVQVRHITSVISNATSNSLSGMFGSNLTNGAGSKNVTLDFWIDENTNYIHEITMRFAITTGSSRTTMTWDANVQENFSNFNRPVTITIPTHAIPATSVNEVLQS
jgi:hypothetical protein